jgi:hypothetical protein
MFIVPGQRLHRDTVEAMTLKDALVTTTASGFINNTVFVRWLAVFAKSLPDEIKRPVVLVCDGYSAHFAHPEVESTLLQHGIKLVCTPANATHLVQPLDVACFGPLKRAIRTEIRQLMLTRARTSVSKAEAVAIACNIWPTAMDGKNATAGFRTCGVFPVNLPAMRARLARFEGTTRDTYDRDDKWLQTRKAIEDEVLTLPAPVSKKRSRKTFDASQGIWDNAQATQMLNAPAKKKRASLPDAHEMLVVTV